MDGMTAEPKTWREKLAFLRTRRFLIIFVLGQFLSLCITATSVINQKLFNDEKVAVPATQTFLVYFSLAVIYTSITIWRDGFWGWIRAIRKRWWIYIILAIVDVEANYLVNKSYQYTNLLSAMLLDSWTIPCIVVFSIIFLRIRYRWTQYVGVFLCLVGMGILMGGDYLANPDIIHGAADMLKGDLFCIAGATLYATSNLIEEIMVRKRPLYEVVGQLGFWATIVSAIQLSVLERDELGTLHNSGAVIGYILTYDFAMVCIYSLAPVLFRLSSATFFNLSLLTSDFYGLLFGLLLFGSRAHYLYPIAYVLIIVGIILYNIFPHQEAKIEKEDDKGPKPVAREKIEAQEIEIQDDKGIEDVSTKV
ncbi:uncharacterized protein VTP21DRAFT_13 [Calcarisporiella thermophila]|uniref:uncharacterized protein n=1 Tax=Calcarisporiella thermophila TaxID=911321 RepID=UPI003741F693